MKAALKKRKSLIDRNEKAELFRRDTAGLTVGTHPKRATELADTLVPGGARDQQHGGLEDEETTEPAGKRQQITSQPIRESFQYPILEAVLAQRGLEPKAIWTLGDVANIFDVAVRTIQDWIRDGKLTARKLPGRGKFLSQDLEEFLLNSARKVSLRDERE